MKIFLIGLIALVPFLALGQQNQFHLKAELPIHTTAKKAFLQYKADGVLKLDSTFIQHGHFELNQTINEPVKAQLTLAYSGDHERNDVMTFYLEPGNINLITRDSIKNSLISGSSINTEAAKLKQTLSQPMGVMAAVNTEFSRASDLQLKDTAFTAALRAKFIMAANEASEIKQRYISIHQRDFFSLFVLNDLAGYEIDFAKVNPIYQNLSEALKSSATGKEFGRLITIAGMTSVGAKAPLFTQIDQDGKAVSLADFKGQYILIDFWASWCGPCRAENPNLVRAYQNYNDKNFMIIGISLDRPGKKADWLAAIKADHLNWIQLTDLKFWDNAVAKQYGIRSIPQNFLIDPNGFIIGKDFKGGALESKLKEILK